MTLESGQRAGAGGMGGLALNEPGLAPLPCFYFQRSVYLASPLFICVFVSF